MEQKTVFRLVTKEDLEANPALVKQGVSINQMHDLPVVEKEEKKKEEKKDDKKKK